MTNTTSVILASVGQAVVSSPGSFEACVSYAAVFWVCQFFVLTAVLPIAEHKRAAVADAGQAPLQQENSPAPAHSSRSKFLADSPLVPALVMFIETLKVRIKKWLLKL